MDSHNLGPGCGREIRFVLNAMANGYRYKQHIHSIYITNRNIVYNIKFKLRVIIIIMIINGNLRS